MTYHSYVLPRSSDHSSTQHGYSSILAYDMVKQLYVSAKGHYDPLLYHPNSLGNNREELFTLGKSSLYDLDDYGQERHKNYPIIKQLKEFPSINPDHRTFLEILLFPTTRISEYVPYRYRYYQRYGQPVTLIHHENLTKIHQRFLNLSFDASTQNSMRLVDPRHVLLDTLARKQEEGELNPCLVEASYLNCRLQEHPLYDKMGFDSHSKTQIEKRLNGIIKTISHPIVSTHQSPFGHDSVLTQILPYDIPFSLMGELATAHEHQHDRHIWDIVQPFPIDISIPPCLELMNPEVTKLSPESGDRIAHALDHLWCTDIHVEYAVQNGELQVMVQHLQHRYLLGTPSYIDTGDRARLREIAAAVIHLYNLDQKYDERYADFQSFLHSGRLVIQKTFNEEAMISCYATHNAKYPCFCLYFDFAMLSLCSQGASEF